MWVGNSLIRQVVIGLQIMVMYSISSYSMKMVLVMLMCVLLVLVGQLVVVSVVFSFVLNVLVLVLFFFLVRLVVLYEVILVLFIFIIVSELVVVGCMLYGILVLVSVVVVMLQELVNLCRFIGLNWNEQVVGLVMISVGELLWVFLMVGLVKWVRFLKIGMQVMVVSRQLVRMIFLWLMWLDSQLKKMKNGVFSVSVVVISRQEVVVLIFSMLLRKNSVQNCLLYQIMVWLVVVLSRISNISFRLLFFRLLWNGVLEFLFLVFICWNSGDLFSCSWIYIEMFSSRIDIRNGMCQFQVLNVLLFRVMWQVRMISSDRNRFSVVVYWMKLVYRLCLLFGVCLVIQVVVLLYLLFIVRFWVRCRMIRIIGVVNLIEVQLGSMLIRKVEMFMIRMVIRKVYLWLMWLLRLLKKVVLNGCMKKLVVNVSRVKIMFVVLLMLLKNCLVMMVVSELYRKKLYYLKIVLRFEVKMIFLWFLVRVFVLCVVLGVLDMGCFFFEVIVVGGC